MHCERGWWYIPVMGLEVFDSPDGVPEFYTDSARMAGNAFTISLEFGVQMNAVEGGPMPPPSKRNVIVRMSPQHALALRDMLVKNLAKYEEMIGQAIPYPTVDEGAIGVLAAGRGGEPPAKLRGPARTPGKKKRR